MGASAFFKVAHTMTVTSEVLQQQQFYEPPRRPWLALYNVMLRPKGMRDRDEIGEVGCACEMATTHPLTAISYDCEPRHREYGAACSIFTTWPDAREHRVCPAHVATLQSPCMARNARRLSSRRYRSSCQRRCCCSSSAGLRLTRSAKPRASASSGGPMQR